MITFHSCKFVCLCVLIFSVFLASPLLSQTFEKAYKDPDWATQFSRVKQAGSFYYACGYVSDTIDQTTFYGDFSKIDLNGNILWTLRPFDSIPCRFFDFEETPGGDFIVVGRTEPATSGTTGLNNRSVICRISPSSNVIFARSYEFSEGREVLFSIKHDADATDTYFISGARENPDQLASTLDDVLIVEMNESGQFVRVSDLSVSIPNTSDVTDNEFFLKMDQVNAPTSVMWTCGVWRNYTTSSSTYGLITGINENDHSVVFPMQLDPGTVVQDILPEASAPLLRVLGVGRHNGVAIFFAYYPQASNGFLWSVKVPGQANFFKIGPADKPDHYFVLGREAGGSDAKYVVHYFNTSGNSPVIEWSKFFDEGETSFSDAGINVTSQNRLLYFDSRQGNPGGVGQEVFFTNFDEMLGNCLAQTPVYSVLPDSLTRTEPEISHLDVLPPDSIEHAGKNVDYIQRALCNIDTLNCCNDCAPGQTLILKENINRTISEAGLDRGSDIAIDDAGYIYVAGRFLGENVDFGGISKSSMGESDIFVAKYNSDLTPVWVHTIGGSGKDEGAAIVVKNGMIYIAGSFSSQSVDFAPNGEIGNVQNILNADGSNWDGFIAKYDSDFKLQHALAFGGDGEDQIRDMTVDNDGNMVVTGKFKGINVNFDRVFLNANAVFSAAQNHVFIAKYNANGNFIGADHFGGEMTPFEDEGWGIIHDADNNIYVTGEVQGQFNGNLFTPGLAVNAFIAKYLPGAMSGNLIPEWRHTLNASTTTASTGFDVAIQDDFLYAVGHFSGGELELVLGGGSSQLMTTFTDAYVAKYDISTNPPGFEVAFQIPHATAHAIHVDNGKVYLGGAFRNVDADFDPSIATVLLPHSGNDDLFVAKYEDLGTGFDFIAAGITPLATVNKDFVNNLAVQCDTIYAVGDISPSAVDFYFGQYICDCTVPAALIQPDQISLTLSPNPTTGRITVNLLNHPLTDGRLLLYDVFGRLVHSEALPNSHGPMECAVENHPPGTYFVEIRAQNTSIWRGKLVKQ